jgi:hypothetical protein
VKRTLSTLASVVAGTALALSLAGPALAATPNPDDSPALQAWLGDGTTQSTAAVPAGATLATASAGTLAVPASGRPTAGMRLTHKHGGPMLWSENILEWYWNRSKITSSTGSQDYGFLFPNTASKGGIVRTLVTTSQHNWRGTMIVGVGIVTPWGAVNISRASKTDYYQLIRGGGDYINP